MQSYAVESFWTAYKTLPENVQKVADKKYELWRKEPFHPSLYFKCVDSRDNIWSVRITQKYRALAVREGNDIVWFWIGDHDTYMKIL